MYSDGCRVKLRVIRRISGSGYVLAENSSWYGLMPESPIPMITNGVVLLAISSAEATVTPIVRRSSNPPRVALTVTSQVPRGTRPVTLVPFCSKTPSKLRSQRTSRVPVTFAFSTCFSPATNRTVAGTSIAGIGLFDGALRTETFSLYVSGMLRYPETIAR